MIQTNGGKLDSLKIQQLGISEGGPAIHQNVYIFSMTPEVEEQVKKLNNVKQVRIMFEKQGVSNLNMFPNDSTLQWNIDNYGPIVVPKKDLTIILNKQAVKIYWSIICNLEHNKLETIKDDIILNGNKTNRYTFKQDYYFVMGDNRHNSVDSRYWGFVPKDHLVGKATTIITSFDKNKSYLNRVRWNRTFKSIR